MNENLIWLLSPHSWMAARNGVRLDQGCVVAVETVFHATIVRP
jgi:hypothetical protein